MTTCDICDRHQLDTAYVCADCAARTARDLEWLAVNAAELETTIARQARIGSGAGGGSAETPLPIDLAASYDRDAVRNVLTTWARDVLEHRAIHPPADTIAGCAAWLAGQLDWLRFRSYARETLDELSDAAALARRVVDSHVQRVYRGPCGATDPETGESCAEDLYAPEAAEVVRCRSCGSETDSARRRAWLLDSVRDQLVPVATIAAVILKWTPWTLDSSTVRKWVQRGQLQPKGRNSDGRETYRVGDALELAEAAARRIAARQLAVV